MSRTIYDNWKRLVDAVLKREQLWQLCHAQSRSPSISSEASETSSNSNYYSPLHNTAFGFSNPGNLSGQQEEEVAKLLKALPKLILVSHFSDAFKGEAVDWVLCEFLGQGTFGSSYKVVMNNGATIVVKSLNKSVRVSEMEFKRNMEVIGNVEHKNVVLLKAYYSFNDERLMLYDHYKKGSVYALLHGQPKGSRFCINWGTRLRTAMDEAWGIAEILSHVHHGVNRAYISWETRLRIAIGAARGIAEIHAQRGGTLVHGNIKSSNILVNSKDYGCISDLGMTHLTETTFTPSGWCYAPEITSTRNATQESDIFGFGILLLELLTRKAPVHLSGGPQAVNLVKLVFSFKIKKWAAKVFDGFLLERSEIRDQVVEMLKIGLRCVAKSPSDRPKISAVVKMLEDLIVMCAGAPSSLQRQLVFVRDDYPEFMLQDMYRASAEKLGQGTVWGSYKTVLCNGKKIVVKLLMAADVEFEKFEKFIYVTERMSHENISSLRAYCYNSRHVNFLVYDFFNQGSVFALLHGERGVGQVALDWVARLKIAVGAARGIAYIHRQDGGNFVHGNIKTTNIFLNDKQYGVVSDIGLQRFTGQVGSSAYCALEYNKTGITSQASDVCSFGVVLLELATGKPSQYTTGDGEVVSLVEWIRSFSRDGWTPEVLDLELVNNETNEVAMLRLLQIGTECVAISPEHRPSMPEIVKMLDEIFEIYVGGLTSVESRLEDMLESLMPKVKRWGSHRPVWKKFRFWIKLKFMILWRCNIVKKRLGRLGEK